MPFPWKKKKNRVARISQFVADFQSPQRTSSLVVQTGFPTSLIDLFAKNRNRFKNSTIKKPVHSEIIDPSSSLSPPPPPPPSPVTAPPSVSESPIHEVLSEEIPVPTESLIGENTDDGAGDVAPVNKRRSSFRSKSIIVKILTVIILAASVKELTVAITVSAFALLFLENALKRVVSFLKPCSNVFVSIESLFQKILFAKSVHKPITVLDEGEIEFLNLNLGSNCCLNDEIEVVEENSELGICRELEDPSTKEIVEEKHMKERIQFRSRSGRFKATMVKKLQKFRSFKKEKKEEEKENHDNNNNVRLDASSDISSLVCEEEDKQEVKNEIDCGINCSREESIVVVGNSSYAILVIIALIGLIVGRLQALFLTIGWCLLVKMIRSIWRSKNVFS